ncbi:hypothetical protein HFO32_11035 [Rhizobium leguminosarum]|uniref:hypothetical protein n=1 Tax=Rhizobium leguminosarum TaxID=384 RepID=UPI001C95DFA9|nr:hypothetical protein [Rhizobium leguminosarum]MBY5682690.1 hypothetical protein [Rhizobium leguminosarum]
MTDRPILFSGPMIRALLDGRKTQTRRLLKPQPKVLKNGSWYRPFPQDPANWQYALGGIIHGYARVRIVEGDRLWVRETWSHTGDHVFSISEARRCPFGYPIYQADDNPEFPHAKFWPSIHMPREFSRLTLTVTDVRVERLRRITEKDAIAEGAELDPISSSMVTGGPMIRVGAGVYLSPVAWYHRLWDEINGAGAWEKDPWVVAYTFTVQRGNIDQIARAA